MAVMSSKQVTVIIVNGNEAERCRLAAIAEDSGYRAVGFGSARELLRGLNVTPPAVLVLDSGPDEMSLDELIDTLHQRSVVLPLLVTVPAGSVSAAVNAIRHDAVDVLEQPLVASRFRHSIETALRHVPRPA